MKKAFLFLILFIFVCSNISYSSNALDSHALTIVSIKRNIPMVRDGRTFKDYYVNLGSVEGAQIGSYINVYRRVSFRQRDVSKPTSDLKVLVAQLRVIYVQNDLSVARLAYKVAFDNVPILEINAPSIGDLVELTREGGKNLVPVDD